MLNIFLSTNFPKKSSPEDVLSLGPLTAVYDPGLVSDGPGGQEEPQSQLLSQQLSQKAIPGGNLAHGLLLAVYGPGLGPDGIGCPEKP